MTEDLKAQNKAQPRQTYPEDEHEFYSHEAGDSTYQHAADRTKWTVLGFAVLLTLSFSAIELIGGIWANSLALIGDAGHMVTDSASLLLRSSPTASRSREPIACTTSGTAASR